MMYYVQVPTTRPQGTHTTRVSDLQWITLPSRTQELIMEVRAVIARMRNAGNSEEEKR